jgi:hypothetical protein
MRMGTREDEKRCLIRVLRELERRRDEAVRRIAEVDGRIADLEAEEIMGECECECVYNGKVL